MASATRNVKLLQSGARSYTIVFKSPTAYFAIDCDSVLLGWALTDGGSVTA